jgi:hypothetical protein
MCDRRSEFTVVSGCATVALPTIALSLPIVLVGNQMRRRQNGDDRRGRRMCGLQRTDHAAAGNGVDGERRVADRVSQRGSAR